MQAITLYHLGVPVVSRPLRLPELTIGPDPGDDLVLAGECAADQRMTISRGPDGGWRARLRGAGDPGVESPLAPGTRVPVGSRFAVELVTLGRGGAPAPGRGRESGPEPAAGAALVGESARMRQVRYEIGRLGRLRAPVLVEGETGTGKELAALSIHAASGRAAGPFVAVNCGALASTLLEDVLFGHERGSFTGAGSIHRGVFERAGGGTLFLDEVGELPPAHQAALLRVLDTRRVTRLGSEREEEVDFRLVAATNRELSRMVGAGGFRPDLYHRLAALRLRMPPLRDRPEDVGPLARRFLAAIEDEVGPKELSEGALAELAAHPWPGNARELRNALYRAAAACPGRTLTEADLELEAPGRAPGAVRFRVNEVPGARIREVMERNGGNVTAAARELGVPRSTLRDHFRKAALGARGVRNADA